MDQSFDDCDGAGVLSTVAGTIGILIANTALNVIIGNENYNEMLVLDLQHNIIQRIAIKNDDNCDKCILNNPKCISLLYYSIYLLKFILLFY